VTPSRVAVGTYASDDFCFSTPRLNTASQPSKPRLEISPP